MNLWKKLISLNLVLVMLLTFVAPAYAAGNNETELDPGTGGSSVGGENETGRVPNDNETEIDPGTGGNTGAGGDNETVIDPGPGGDNETELEPTITPYISVSNEIISVGETVNVQPSLKNRPENDTVSPRFKFTVVSGTSYVEAAAQNNASGVAGLQFTGKASGTAAVQVQCVSHSGVPTTTFTITVSAGAISCATHSEVAKSGASHQLTASYSTDSSVTFEYSAGSKIGNVTVTKSGLVELGDSDPAAIVVNIDAVKNNVVVAEATTYVSFYVEHNDIAVTMADGNRTLTFGDKNDIVEAGRLDAKMTEGYDLSDVYSYNHVVYLSSLPSNEGRLSTTQTTCGSLAKVIFTAGIYGKARFDYTITPGNAYGNMPLCQGRVTINYDESRGDIEYETTNLQSVTFSERDFDEFWMDSGAYGDLEYVRFTSLQPTYGKLYTENTPSSAYLAQTTDKFYYGSTSSSSYKDLGTVTYFPATNRTTAYDVSIPFAAYGEDSRETASGYVVIHVEVGCGPDLTWSLDDNGILTISGTGEMTAAPWDTYKDQITSVIVEEGVTSIWDGAFHKCSALTSVSLPQSLTTIGDSAFHSCTALETIALPESLASIGWGVFYGCSSLEVIDLPENLVSINSRAFAHCTALKSISFPETLKQIGYEAFYGCTGLESIAVPVSLNHIEDYAFEGCTGLTEIDIPAIMLQAIGVFNGCGTIETVTISDSGQPATGDRNIFGYTHIKELVIDGGYKNAPIDMLTRIESSYSHYTTVEKLTYKTESPNEVVASWYVGDPDVGETDVKATVYNDGRMVISGQGAIASHPWGSLPVLSVTMSNGITGVCANAFANFHYLTDVTLGSRISRIESYAFANCSRLTSIQFPDRLSYIGSNAFANCKKLEEAILGDNVETIGTNAFYRCYSLKTVRIGKAVTDFNKSVFENCNALETVYWDAENVEMIGSHIFNAAGVYSENGIQLIIGDNVEKIPDNLFYASSANLYYPRLTDISVSENGSLKEIGNNAFHHCADLTNVDLGDRLTAIGRNAFSLCASLAEIALPDSLQTIGYKAFFGTALTNVTLGRNVSSVDPDAFEESDLKTVTGYIDTYAETYANKNGYAFIALPRNGDASETMSWNYDAKTGTVTFTGSGDIVFGDWLKQCQGFTSMMIPEGCTGLDGDASDYRTLFSSLQAIYFLGDAPTLLNEEVFSQQSDAVNIYYLKGAYGWNRVDWPNCELRSFVNEKVTVTLRSQNPENGKFTNFSIPVYRGTDLDLSTYTEQLEQERLDKHDAIGQLAMWTDQNGTGYLGDGIVTVSEDLTLEAQWDTAVITIDGKYYNVKNPTVNENWFFRTEGTTYRYKNADGYVYEYRVQHLDLELRDYIGGSIELPESELTYTTNISAYGKNVIGGHIKGGYVITVDLYNGSLDVTSPDVCLETEISVQIFATPSSLVTLSSTGSEPAVRALMYRSNANGQIDISAKGDVAVETNSATLNGSGEQTFSALRTAVSGKVSYSGRTLDCYLSPDAETPSDALYDGEPYLRLKAKVWSMILDPSGGVWDDGTKTARTVTSALTIPALSLAEYSKEISKSGYQLIGWTNADGSLVFEQDEVVISGQADVLYAVWQEDGVQIDGAFYPIGKRSYGTGWSLSNRTLSLDDTYSAGQITVYGNITINVTDDLAWYGPVGYPALSACGDVTLNVNCSKLIISGGSGANALSVSGNLTIQNEKELVIRGGAGGCGIECEDLTFRNSGSVSVVGGINGHAVAGRHIAINEIGTTTFVGGATRAFAMAPGGGFSYPALKVYSGENVSSVARELEPGAKYIRFEKKSVIINLNLVGGSVSAAQMLSAPVDQNEANEIVLDLETPTKFGHTFQGWQDSTGKVYENGATYALPETQDTLSLQAMWEVQDYEVRKTENSVEIALKEDIPTGTSLLLTSYTASGKMQQIEYGTYVNGVYRFNSLPDGEWKIFFVDGNYAPTQEQLAIEP